MARVLTWISQSTRGVIAVATDSKGIENVMKEAKRLNMVSGDFVWIWMDTGVTTTQQQQIRVVRSPARSERNDDGTPAYFSAEYDLRTRRYAERRRRSNLTSEWPRVRRLRELPPAPALATMPR